MESAIYFPCSFNPSCNQATGKVNKGYRGTNGWNDLTESLPCGNNRAIQTGKRSNITVIDVDDMKSYDELITAVPTLKDAYHVKTRQGYHLYFKYNEQLKTVADCFKIKGIDIRNDGGCIIAPPSSYTINDVTVKYEVIDGKIADIPDELFQYVKPSAWKEKPQVQKQPKNGKIIDTDVMKFAQLVALLNPVRAEEYDNWSKVGFGIKNVLGHNEDAIDLFASFSSQSAKFDKAECIKFFQSIKIRQDGDNKITESTFHKWAKEDNPEQYALYQKTGDKIVESDFDAATMIYNELKSNLFCCEHVVYYKTEGIWVSETEVSITALIRLYVLQSNMYKHNEKGEKVIFSQNVKNANNVVTALLDIVKGKNDDTFTQKMFASSLGYVLFNDGYWDFKNSIFVENDSEDFDNDIIFTAKIPFEYEPEWDDPKAEEMVKETLFTLPFGATVGEYYCTQLARGLAGDCVKRFLLGVGPSNSGKSLLSFALNAACGGYFGAYNGANLAYKSNSDDEAKNLRWMYLLRNKRIIVSSELKANMPIDGNMLKKMSNGAKDPIVARVHGGNEINFFVPFLPILFCQDITIKPMDDAVVTRTRCIPYTKVYTDNPSNELELPKDPLIEKAVVTSVFKLAFLRIMFKAYSKFVAEGEIENDPPEIQVQNTAVLGTETTIIDAFKNNYEITNNKEDYILSSDIQKWLTDEKKAVSITKFGLEMNRYAAIKKLENVMTKQKKIEGKNKVIWIGIKIAEED
jgi:hypothetical protein